MIGGGQRVLVVAAHPDDEVLGCGGSVARHVRASDEVRVLILAAGGTGRSSNASEDLRESANAAAAILGVGQVKLANFPDQKLDQTPLLDLTQAIEEQMREFSPTIVLSHASCDVNRDHTMAHEAVLAACRPVPGSAVRELLFFETPSSTEWRPSMSEIGFHPSLFVDISDVLSLKLKALQAYEQEMRPWPHPRSYEAIEHLARWRGATVGLPAAEAFVVGRQTR